MSFSNLAKNRNLFKACFVGFICIVFGLEFYRRDHTGIFEHIRLSSSTVECEDVMWQGLKQPEVEEMMLKSQVNTNITVVTAFFDFGSFPKGDTNNKFTGSMYRNWAKTFHFLRNPLIVYTDSGNFKQYMLEIRADLMNYTQIIHIDRSSSWAFRNIDRIRTIFTSSGYPKYYPNTVISEYACAQHAKSDVLSRAAEENVFKSKYYMWLDVGYFRDKVGCNQTFYLSKPIAFNDSKIAMNRIHEANKLSATPRYIFRWNQVHVGGGIMFGERLRMIKFASQVKRAVGYFLTKGLANTDQQVIYAMFSDEGKEVLKPEVEIQYYCAPPYNSWFYLGFSMMRTLDSEPVC